MKVNQTTSSAVQSGESAKQSAKAEGAQKAKSKAGAAAAQAKTTVPGSVNAEISSRGKEMAIAKAAVADAPETREERIAALKARIAAGKYQVDNAAVADRMVDEHLKTGIG